ncbi:MAG: site-specific DNA-methyltransferase, partial [Acidobacteria bacterium]|nr:site-specific DNA-methyltransferase [Acidobacteriota bacterium]
MAKTMNMDDVTLYLGDCLDVLPVECDAVVVDPPYNIGKAAWDKIPDYLQWCETWIAAASKGCKRQGAFWCFHSEPGVLVDLSRMIAKHGRPRQNWITWDKYNEQGAHSMKGFLDGYTLVGNLRRFQDFAEYIVYHADDGQWTAQSDECRGFIFEPLRAYLAGERDRAGIDNATINAAWCAWKGVACTSQTQKWFSSSCFNPPTREAYEWLRSLFNATGGDYLRREYDDLRREYDDLRREYEHLRPTFNNPGKVSSVWQYPPAKANGHETPKPVELMQRIIETTTNLGDTVLDCFMGSGTTGVACVRTGRRFV